MASLLILGGGKEQLPAIERAKRKGIYTIVFDMNKDAAGSTEADEFHAISTRDIDAMVSFLKGYDKKIDGVMTIASDIPHCVSAVGEFLGLKCIPLSVAQIAVNKLEMKKLLKSKGVNVPPFRQVNSLEELKGFISEYGYPVVIKPIDNSGARGVLRITENIDLEWAYNYSSQFSRSGDMLVEKYLTGPQISNEGLVYKGNFYITGFSDRCYDRLEQFAPHIVEDGGAFPTLLSTEEKNKVNDEFEKAVKALGINWGPAKGDMVYSDGKAYVIEIAARLSGGNFCYDQVPMGTGVDIVDILIDMVVENEIDVEKFKPTKDLGVAQRYFFPTPGKIKEIRGLEIVKSMPNIKKIDFFAKVGDVVEKTVSHPSRVGYVIALGKDKQEAVYLAKKAIETIEFVME